ncbi:MAG: hypothetical protein SOT34_04530 [Candidatus Borkfalkiaceae bacterium]|nr:hypothetical protein [Christensenellaceae bacterium]
MTNFGKESVLEVGEGDVVLSNLNGGKASGIYRPYECAVIRAADAKK